MGAQGRRSYIKDQEAEAPLGLLRSGRAALRPAGSEAFREEGTRRRRGVGRKPASRAHPLGQSAPRCLSPGLLIGRWDPGPAHEEKQGLLTLGGGKRGPSSSRRWPSGHRPGVAGTETQSGKGACRGHLASGERGGVRAWTPKPGAPRAWGVLAPCALRAW